MFSEKEKKTLPVPFNRRDKESGEGTEEKRPESQTAVKTSPYLTKKQAREWEKKQKVGPIGEKDGREDVNCEKDGTFHHGDR